MACWTAWRQHGFSTVPARLLVATRVGPGSLLAVEASSGTGKSTLPGACLLDENSKIKTGHAIFFAAQR